MIFCLVDEVNDREPTILHWRWWRGLWTGISWRSVIALTIAMSSVSLGGDLQLELCWIRASSLPTKIQQEPRRAFASPDLIS